MCWERLLAREFLKGRFRQDITTSCRASRLRKMYWKQKEKERQRCQRLWCWVWSWLWGLSITPRPSVRSVLAIMYTLYIWEDEKVVISEKKEGDKGRHTIDNDVPAAPNIMSCRRPNFSIVKTAIHEARKNSRYEVGKLVKDSPYTWSRIGNMLVAWLFLTCAQGGCHDPGGERTQLYLIFENRSGVISNEIDTRNLLKHLINIGQAGPVKMAILIARKQIPQSSLSRLKHGLLDCTKFTENIRVVRRPSTESAEDVEGFVFVTR